MYKVATPEDLPVMTDLLRFFLARSKSGAALTETIHILWLNEFSVYKQGETGMYQTIIMPVDVFEMELSDKAVRHAEFLAQQDGIIHLLHVLPGSASLSLHRFAADVRRFEEHLQHEAENRLQTMVGHFSIDPSRIKTHVRFGSVRDAVNELANELKADVVVIGSRNPSITTHLLGSNASSVIRHTHIPVMVVR